MFNRTKTGKDFAWQVDDDGLDLSFVTLQPHLSQPVVLVHYSETRQLTDGPVASGPAPDTADSFPQASASAASYAGSSSASNVGAAASIATLANYLVKGFWQYNNTIAHYWGSTAITYNINALNAAEKFLAQSALNAWHEVTNVTFVQTTGAANITYNHNGSMTAYETDSYNSSGIISSATIDISADWITSDGGAMDGKTGIDSYGYQTYIHETGHALGLGHQGPYNGSASYSTNAVFANDTWQYSVMSYFSEPNYNGSSYRYVVTPQMADIYAADSIYGVATTRTGNTVYGFHNTAGSIFDFTAYAQAPALTIYDSGGTDTLDCSGYSSAQVIDLHPGSFSSVGGLVHNIGIALNATIEIAVGGSGDDTLIASDYGCTLQGGGGSDILLGGNGSDVLIGGLGVDILTGGGGADNFVFASGDSSASAGQHDRIADFSVGVDRIDLTGIDAIAGNAGVDAFRFLGAAVFDGAAGALDYFYDGVRGMTVLQGDTNGDRIADFAIDLVGNLYLAASGLLGIIPPVTTVIETNGSVSFTSVGNEYYLYQSGVGPSLKYAGVNFVIGQSGNWTPFSAERTASGYEVAFKLTGSDLYTVWNTDSNGNFISNIGGVSGNSIALMLLESSFHQDLNGDGSIGAASTTIESYGSTTLTQAGSNFFLNTGGLSLSLKYAGSDAVATPGGWMPIGAEQIAGGYEVAWKLAGTTSYTVWYTDGNGNFISNIGAVSETSTALMSLETGFHQDLNGDGTIGASATTIEANGSTSLVQAGTGFYMYTGGDGPSLKFAGVDVVANPAGWVPIGAEQTAGGYEVAWKLAGTSSYTVWSTDSSGNFISNIGAVSGSSNALMSLEASFHQDLNGDGTIGSASTTLEASGSTSLVASGANFYLYTGGTGPSLKFAGVDFVANPGGWTPIGAEKTAGGYEVAWKLAGTSQYTVWSTDSNGNFLSNIGAVSGTSYALESRESAFHQDLNSDGVIGLNSPTSSAILGSQGATLNEAIGGIVGSAEADTFVFKSGFGNATIADFQPGKDTIEFDHSLFANVSGILPGAADDGHGNTIITTDAHDSLTLLHVTLADVQRHLADFHVV